ncbi:MAG: acyltransferase domain-containing protein, partial [Alphaproteobacteria bacterium]
MTQTAAEYDIAITGYACRLPGAPDAAAFWNVLAEGRCVISRIGPDRFEPGLLHDPDPAARGKSYSFAAGQIDDIWGFDPGFFAISPREAAQMDPQQRILLQVVWEALEHAGLTQAAIAGERTGVFVGASSSDHSAHFFTDLARVDAQFMTGNTLSIIANRISYLLDLRGPSFTIDTACSSSLYALHAAAQALMAGEIDTAIVGGVNLLVAPGPFVGFSRATMLSPTGLCRAFDAGADGYVRSEGAVVFVLRRLDRARADGDPVRGILAGTGINSDGRTVGMALPSASRQADLLRLIRDRFGLNPDRLAFIEAHGTGTPVGDPLEARAIGAVYGAARAQPLPIGSAKSNFGHLEPASGLVGLLKAQLALERGQLPATLHVRTPNPNIDFDGLRLALAREPVAIPPGPGPWYAGVNSFGFGGANAHALLRQPRPEERCAPDAPAPARPGPLTLSAASAESLGRLAAAWRARIAAADPAELPDLVASAAWRREALPHRLVALGGDRAALIAQLDAHAEGRRAPGLVTGRAPREGGRTALLFSGNGSQWPGMGRHLLASDEAFRARFDEVAALFAGLGGPDLHALIADPELEGKLGSSQVAQPVLFAVQMALVAALAARGLRPDAVAGHSVGEVAAACTAGILSLGDAVHLVHSRSRALDSLRGSGGMAAISAGAAEVTAALAEAGLSGISVAGINSPRSVTVSGDREQLSALLGWLRRKRRVAGVMLDVEIPYHSAAVEPLRARMIEDLRGLVPAPGQLLYASATTGQIADGRALDCDYWWRNARDVVRFQEAVGALVAAGCRAFVEISPRPVLAAYVRDTLRGLGASGEVVRTMDQGAQADTDAAEMVARAHAVGARVERGAFFGPRPHSHPDLPAYPWNNDRFRAPPTPDHLDPWGLDDFHPLIGRAPQPGVPVWRGDLGIRSLPWLADHAVDGAAVFPAAGLVEMALAAGMRMLGTESLEVSDLEILRPLSLEGEGADLRVSGDPQTGALRIEARPRLSDGGWALHAMATVRAAPSPALPDIPPPEGGEELAGAQLYATLAGLGLQYGPRFRLADRVLSAGNRAETMILGEAGPADGRLLLNPARLDAALHAVFPILMAHRPADGARAPVFLPVRIGRLRLARAGVAAAAARVEVTRQGARGVELRLVLLDAAGAPVAAAEGVRLQALRLQGRSEREATRWRQRLIRLRAPDARVALPGAWAVPADRLRALGVASESEPEPDAGALLVDAACRRIAWDACLSLADAEGRLDAPPSPLADRILAALAEDGLADPAAGRLLTAAEVPYPPTGELIALLMREAPDRAAELQELMRLETRLADLLRAGGGTEPAGAPAPDTGAGRRAMAAMLGRIAADLVAGWPATDRLSVLLLGAAPASLVATLADSPRVDGVVLSAPSRREVDLMRQTIPARPGLAVLPLDEALTPLRHDVVLSLDALCGLDAAQRDRLAGAMALGGLLVGIEAAPSLMQDLRAALAGRTPDARDARRPEDLPGEAFRDIAVLPLAGGAVEAHVVLARPRQQAIRAGRPEPGAAAGRLALVVLSDTRPESRDFARLVAASLTTAGVAVRECLAGDDLALQEPASEVIHLAHLPRAGEDGLETAARRIAALRAVMAMPHRPERVWVVTRGGRPATDAEGPARIPAEAALWGAARVLANEVPGTRLHLVDFDPALAVEVQAEELSLLILSGGEEREVVIDAAGMRAPRVEPLPVADSGGGDALRLEIGQQAAIDSLVWRRAARRAPGPGEVEIEVRAAGLNFRDLMWAQGLLPDEALEDGFAGATLGMECAG